MATGVGSSRLDCVLSINQKGALINRRTVGNIGNFWLITKSRFFFHFGAIFGDFSNVVDF